MTQVTTTQGSVHIVEEIPWLEASVQEVIVQYKYYVDSIRNETFQVMPNEPVEQAIKRGEGIFDRLDEVERRRKLVVEKGKEAMQRVESLWCVIEGILNRCKNDEEVVGKSMNEVIKKIIELEKRKKKELIKPLQTQINAIEKQYREKKLEWETHLNVCVENKIKEERQKKKEEKQKRKKEYKMKMLQEEAKKKEEEKKKQCCQETEEQLRIKEMKQFEEWTNRKVGGVLFDSYVSDWNQRTSVCDKMLIGKEHILFVIEDTNGNKFGGYIDAKINVIGNWMKDQKAFLFSLRSNGGLSNMMKFPLKQNKKTFNLGTKSDNFLFLLGDGLDIFVYKGNNKSKSYCRQNFINCNGISNTLCGKKMFTPRRIVISQML
ncbi:hypothetical protein, conserved [Entamoeba histolytica]